VRTKFLVLLSTLLCILNANAQTVQTGYIRLVPDEGSSAPAGIAIFGQQTNGVLISEAGVPSSTAIQSGRIFADVNGPVNTGIALANPGGAEAVISFYFTDNTGRDFGARSFTLPAKKQIAAFLNENPFGLTSSLSGTFTFNSSVPVGAIALRSLINERNEVLMTTLPVSPIGSGFGGNALVIPHFSDGGGWSTQIVLVNPGEVPLSGRVQFFGQGSKVGKAQPLRVVINGSTDSTFDYTVPPRSAVRMRTQPARPNAEVGSVHIVPAPSSGAPSSLAIFSLQNEGVTVSAASVSALPVANALRMYVESKGSFGKIGSVQTGLAISNPSESRIAVQLDVLELDGTYAGSSTHVEIAPGGHIAKFANEFFPQLRSPFKGIIKISAPSPIAVSGLRGRYNERGDLLVTTTPPHIDGSALQTEISFPHFVAGGGYFTQLILLSTGVPHSGSLWIMSKDGEPMGAGNLRETP
jgi:hypothetical protein